MASSNMSWGIEIGAGGVRAIKLGLDGDAVRVLDFVSFDHPKVLSTPDLDEDDALRVAVGTLASRYDLTGAQVAISIPGHQSFARFAKLPPVEPKKVPDIVKFEAVQQIPFPLEDVEWDFQTFASHDSPEVEVGIFAVTRDRILERLRLLEDVGIVPDIATLSPISVYNAFAHDLEFTENMPGTILLDIGTMATDLVIAHSGRVWVRTFPIGGHQFTEALVETFKVPYSKAEKLKREAEQTKHARHVFQAMRPVFTDLVQEVQRSIGYYQSLHPEAKLKRLIGTGSTFRLPGLRKYLKQQLQLDVYRLEQFKRLNVDGPRAGEFQNDTLNLSSAYGLALQGLGMSTLNANLMPVQMVRDAMWKRKIGWFGAAAAVAAVASAAMFIRPVLDNAAVTAAGTPALFGQAINEANAAKARAQAAGVLNDSGQTLNAEQMISLIDSNQIHADILADLGEMFANAEQAGRGTIPSGRPAFVLRELSTDFRPAAASEAAADQGSGGRNEFDPGGGNDSMFIQPVQTQVRPRSGARTNTSDDPEELKDKRRIRVEAIMTTAHPSPQDFMIETMEAWLLANKERPDLSYTIFFEEEMSKFTELDPTDTRANPNRRPDPRQTQSNIINVPGTPTRDPGFIDPVGRSPAGRSPIRGGTGTTDIESLARIVPPVDRSGGPTGEFSLVWYVVLDAPAEGGDE